MALAVLEELCDGWKQILMELACPAGAQWLHHHSGFEALKFHQCDLLAVLRTPCGLDHEHLTLSPGPEQSPAESSSSSPHLHKHLNNKA